MVELYSIQRGIKYYVNKVAIRVVINEGYFSMLANTFV